MAGKVQPAAKAVTNAASTRHEQRASIAHIMRAYAFVGIQEMYEISFRTLTALAGRPTWPSLRANVNDDDEDERRVTTAMAQRIREANRLDLSIYDHFHARLAGAAPALAEALGP